MMRKFMLAVAFVLASAVACEAKLADRQPVRKATRAAVERTVERAERPLSVLKKLLQRVVHPRKSAG